MADCAPYYSMPSYTEIKSHVTSAVTIAAFFLHINHFQDKYTNY